MESSKERWAEWQRLVDEQLASGLSAVAWCRARGINYNTFNYRRKRATDFVANADGRRLSGSAPQPKSLATEWLSVAVSEPAVDSLTLRVGRVEIELTSGFDERLLSDVLNVLEARI